MESIPQLRIPMKEIMPFVPLFIDSFQSSLVFLLFLVGIVQAGVLRGNGEFQAQANKR